MKLAPSFPSANVQLIQSGQSEVVAETRRAYADEGEIGAGSFRGYFGMSVDEHITGKSVLDLGSGSGGRAAYWKRELAASRVVGVDIFPQEVIGAHRAVSDMGTHVSFVVGFGELLPFADGVFDTILSMDVLEHTRYPEKVLGECHRVLAHGGVSLMVFPPFYHPTGHHLSFVTKFPWLQFFDANAVTLAFNDIADSRGERAQWYRRGPLMPYERLGWLNGLTIRQFCKLVRLQSWQIEYWDYLPLLRYGWVVKKRPYLRLLSWPLGLLTRLPYAREVFTHRVVCVLRKPIKM